MFDAPPMRWGRDREAVAMSIWREAIDDIYGDASIFFNYPVPLRICPWDEFIAATPDCEFTSRVPAAPLWLTEFKCPWSVEPPRTADQIQLQYILQCMHQMYVTEAAYTLLVYTWFDVADPDAPNKAVTSQWLILAPDRLSYEQKILNPIRKMILGPEADYPPLAPNLQGFRRSLNHPLLAPWIRSHVVGSDASLAQARFYRIQSQGLSSTPSHPSLSCLLALEYSLGLRPRDHPHASDRTPSVDSAAASPPAGGTPASTPPPAPLVPACERRAGAPLEPTWEAANGQSLLSLSSPFMFSTGTCQENQH